MTDHSTPAVDDSLQAISMDSGPRIWPEPLRAGDVVTVVAPSGPSDADRIRAGAEILRSWGLEVRYSLHALGTPAPGPQQRLSYLSADDPARADDFTAAWTDPATSAIWAARGGYGAQRMVDMINFDALRSAGVKHLIGFSDITALHARLGRELGQVTVHGPVVGSLAQLTDTPSVTQLRRLIMKPARRGTVLSRGAALVSGRGEGRLIGGNLSLVASDIGVEPIPTEACIAVFEDVGEDSYRVDRMLTQLLRSGWFDSVVGVVVGDFTECDDAALVAQAVADRLGDLGVPVLWGATVGHGDRNLALPLGAQVCLDADFQQAVLTLC